MIMYNDQIVVSTLGKQYYIVGEYKPINLIINTYKARCKSCNELYTMPATVGVMIGLDHFVLNQAKVEATTTLNTNQLRRLRRHSRWDNRLDILKGELLRIRGKGSFAVQGNNYGQVKQSSALIKLYQQHLDTNCFLDGCSKGIQILPHNKQTAFYAGIHSSSIRASYATDN